MKNATLIQEIHKRTKIPADDIRRILWVAADVIKESVALGDDVTYHNFGRFVRRVYQARNVWGTWREAHIGIKFRLSPKERLMEKYGVVFEDLEKQGEALPENVCPVCKKVCKELRHCPKCGTEPWEKKEPTDGR